MWLDPYPDELLNGVPDTDPGPDAVYEAREAVSLAFVAALQLLPPRQRAVPILRDVLGYRAKDVAQMLDTTEESVASAHKRARAAARSRLPLADPALRPPPPRSAAEYALAEWFAAAFEAGDVGGVVGPVTEGVSFTMPLCRGAGAGATAQRGSWPRCGRPCQRGGWSQPARTGSWPSACTRPICAPDLRTRSFDVMGLLALTLRGDRVSAITRCGGGVLPSFGLPQTIGGAA